MVAYYNENDLFAAQWLRNLITEGLIPAGDVDERSIKDVHAIDTIGYDQCHFFAGVGGWPVALSLAGWPEDEPVWTGSCPCQPFSNAGKRRGIDDDRHLWPWFRDLIEFGGPATVFGEQIASKDGREWLSGVRLDLEALGYAVGAADLCAAGVGEAGKGRIVYPGGEERIESVVLGAPHIRQRLWWVADSYSERSYRIDVLLRKEESGRKQTKISETTGGGAVSGVVDSESRCRRGIERESREDDGQQVSSRESSPSSRVADSVSAGRSERGSIPRSGSPTRSCSTSEGFWSEFDVIPCRDGKARRVEPGSFPLAHGAPARVGRLRGYGNAIDPWVAAEFIASYMECRT